MTTGDQATIAVLVLSLKALTDPELAAFNNAVNGRGRVATTNLAYAKALDLALIREDGSFHDLLHDACAYAVKQRFPAEWERAGDQSALARARGIGGEGERE